jgi:peptidoglycan/xylan/chitin deacetylase (PgdA/CDA1 family)
MAAPVFFKARLGRRPLDPSLFILGGAALAGGFLAARFHFWRPDLPGVPVLMYHYLAERPEGTRLPKLWVHPRAFARQMEYLARKGRRTISLADYGRHLAQGTPLPPRPLLITFDDGARDTLWMARPLMDRHGFTGVVFAVSGLVGGQNDWDQKKGEPAIPLADWADLADLVRAGWEVGSHTRTHTLLPSLSDPDLAGELAGSRREIEARLGVEVRALAYPFGGHDERVRRAALQAGYSLGFGIRHGKSRTGDDPMALSRLIVKRRDTRWDLALKLAKGRSTF